MFHESQIVTLELLMLVTSPRIRIKKEAVRQKMEELNLRELRQREGSRRSAYLEEEKAFMKPLPSQRYELATISRSERTIWYPVPTDVFWIGDSRFNLTAAAEAR